MRSNNNSSPTKDWRDLQSDESLSDLSLSYSTSKIINNGNHPNNISLANLKDSIQKDLRSYKKITQKNDNSLLKSSISNTSMTINQNNTKNSEKEKLKNYFQSIKHTLTTSTNTQSKNDGIDINTNNNNNNYIIYETFRNMMNKGSKRETPRLPSEITSGSAFSVGNGNTLSNLYHNNQYTNKQQNMMVTDIDQLSIINDLQNMKIEEYPNQGSTNYAYTPEIVNYDNEILKKIEQVNKIKNKANEAFFKKKYFQLKSQLKSLRVKMSKEKNINEMLTLKLFYETHKKDPQIMNQDKITQMLTEKLEENLNIFDKLENEISTKDKILEEKDAMILHQKDIIDKLLEQINTESCNPKK